MNLINIREEERNIQPNNVCCQYQNLHGKLWSGSEDQVWSDQEQENQTLQIFETTLN